MIRVDEALCTAQQLIQARRRRVSSSATLCSLRWDKVHQARLHGLTLLFVNWLLQLRGGLPLLACLATFGLLLQSDPCKFVLTLMTFRRRNAPNRNSLSARGPLVLLPPTTPISTTNRARRQRHQQWPRQRHKRLRKGKHLLGKHCWMIRRPPFPKVTTLHHHPELHILVRSDEGGGKCTALGARYILDTGLVCWVVSCFLFFVSIWFSISVVSARISYAIC